MYCNIMYFNIMYFNIMYCNIYEGCATYFDNNK